MKKLITSVMALTLGASAAIAGGPIVIEEEMEVIVEKPASSMGILPLLLIPIILCVALCGGDVLGMVGTKHTRVDLVEDVAEVVQELKGRAEGRPVNRGHVVRQPFQPQIGDEPGMARRTSRNPTTGGDNEHCRYYLLTGPQSVLNYCC